MAFTNRHMLIVGRLFLALFIVANSGYTVALTACTMEGDEDSCAMGRADAATACGHDETSHPATAVTNGGVSCMLTTVAGGLQTDPTTLEKASGARNVLVKLADLAVEPPVVLSDQLNYQNFSFLLSSTSHVSPPSVEKYVLNATFLI